MKILFIASTSEDYLADSLLHGLRMLLGHEVIDVPKNKYLYNKHDAGQVEDRPHYGLGFTLYTGLLPDISLDRSDIDLRLEKRYFDLIVIGNIWRQLEWLSDNLGRIGKTPLAIVDGEDSPRIFPYAGKIVRNLRPWTVPRVLSHYPYFKREWTAESYTSFSQLALKRATRRKPDRMCPISFSIPEEKLIPGQLPKTKLLPAHIVDTDVIDVFGEGQSSYAFRSETEYYRDLQDSRFGITTKRSGWDCMRHYEIAANGAVPCFRNLDSKPKTCAPHGLNLENSIHYQTADELRRTIETLSDERYEMLQHAALAWARHHTTVAAAKRFLDDVKSFYE